jgi:hypothetical protein
MTAARTKNDAIGIYRTGNGGTDGRRIAVQQPRISGIYTGNLSGVLIECVSGNCGEGLGAITAVSQNSLAFAAPDENFGDAVTIESGESRILHSESASKWIRVLRVSSNPLGEMLMLEFNAVALRDCDDSFRESGGMLHHQFFLKNHSSADVSEIKIHLNPIAAAVATSVAQLPATGAGEIETSASLGSWPSRGVARIVDSGGALREIIYYERDGNVLSVAEAHRALAGTAESAGDSTDTVQPIPPCVIGIEPIDANGFIQPNAVPENAPAGVEFVSPTTIATALDAGELRSGESIGLWVALIVPPDMVGGKHLAYDFNVAFNHDGDSFAERMRAIWHVLDRRLQKINVYVGRNAFPDYTAAPFAVLTGTPPFSIPIDPPTIGVDRIAVMLRPVNDVGLESLSTLTSFIDINSDGEEVRPQITAPFNIIVEEIGGGRINIRALYDISNDSPIADRFRIYIRDDGTAPDPGTDTPIDLPMPTISGISMYAQMSYSPDVNYEFASTVSVLVRTYSSAIDTESENTEAVGVVISQAAPTHVPHASTHLGTVAVMPEMESGSFERVDMIDETHDVRIVQTPGATEFLRGSTAIWRVIWDSNDDPAIYISPSWTLVNDTVGGAGSSSGIEVVDADTIYLCSGGTRVVKIDLASQTITAPQFMFSVPAMLDAMQISGTVIALPTGTLFQTWDRLNARWRPAIVILDDLMATSIAVKQTGG